MSVVRVGFLGFLAASVTACVFDPPGASTPDFGDEVRDGGITDRGVIDLGTDSGLIDAGPEPDSGPSPDGGDAGNPDLGSDAGVDTGVPDTGVPDQGVPDMGVPDTGGPDQGVPDTGAPDLGFPDLGFPDQGVPDSGVVDTGVPDTGTFDSGVPVVPFGYSPANVSANTTFAGLWRITSGDTCTFDSDTLAFTGLSSITDCGTPPTVTVRAQNGGGPSVALLEVPGMRMEGVLVLRGSRPTTILVYGDAFITGIIDLGAVGLTAGPGADAAGTCPLTGANLRNGTIDGDGGGGGGFAGIGRNGGAPNGNPGGQGGPAEGDPTLTPLRGGCSGGDGAPLGQPGTQGDGGGGGGALQISVAGTLRIEGTGQILAVGGGGRGGNSGSGGGGGGSGGGVLLEAADLVFDGNLQMGGGGGGGGGASGSADGEDGEDGDTVGNNPARAGSAGSPGGGNGGPGGIFVGNQATPASPGRDPGNNNGGGGGGGGGYGRARLNTYGSCAGNGTWTGQVTWLGVCPF